MTGKEDGAMWRDFSESGLSEASDLREMSKRLRRSILTMTNHAKNGHVGGSLSEIDILAALYRSVMDIDPQDPKKPDRDRFILSKGHASPGLYATLAACGYFDSALLATFDQAGSILQAHPDMRKCPGIDYSTGSLGQGLSVGIGIALGASARKLGFCTFVMVGDGESQEGQLWEAAMYAGANRVRNLVLILDNNGVQLSSSVKDSVDISPVADKFAAFRWQALEVDGHDHAALVPALRAAKARSKEGPVALIAHTVKGKGVSFMEHQFIWHAKAPNGEELALALRELD
jgi:transketolase